MKTIVLVAVIAGCGGVDQSAQHECAALLSVCAKASDCCSGLCTPTANGTICACLSPHDPCTRDEQCCTRSCNAGSCACASSGASCNGDSDCCSGLCTDGVCTAPPDLAQPPDLAPPPPCDPVQQTNCPPGQACYANGATPTCETAGSTHTGGGCSYNDECVAGDECYGYADKSCHMFCVSDGDCQVTPADQLPVSPSNVSYCARTLNGSALTLCTQPCNPVTALGWSGCSVGKCGSHSLSAGRAEYTDCIDLGSGAEGSNCSYDEDCGEGMGCFGESSTAQHHCRHYCRAGNNNDCGGETCYGVTGWTQFGICCPTTGC